MGEDGIKVLILLSAKVKELLAGLKEELDGPPLGIALYYLLAREIGVGAQKDHPPRGLFRLREHQGYRVKVRDLHDKSAGIKVERREVVHLLLCYLSVEPL